MNTLLNDVILSQDIVDAFFGMDADVTKACDEKAKQICAKFFPKIDISREENIELVVRPMSAVIALNELLLQNIFSYSTIDGIYLSKTLPDKIKVPLLQNYAILNGIHTVSKDVESLYSEIKFGVKSNSMNRETNIRNILENSISDIDRLMFIESDMREMDRNKLSYVQINHIDAMNFKRLTTNAGTIIDTAYNRNDYQRYLEYIESDSIELPGTLDIYFSSGLVTETITISRDSDGLFNFEEGYYISIKTDKTFALLEDDKRKWGITKSAPRIYVSASDEEEEFEVIKYRFVDLEGEINTDDFTVVDVLFKGFYPLFIDFSVYTKDGNVDNNTILLSIQRYLDSISGNMSLISHNDMTDFIKKDGNNVVIASTNSASGFTNMNMEFETSVTFPISMKDISIPPEIRRESISERTIKVFARSVNVIKE